MSDKYGDLFDLDKIVKYLKPYTYYIDDLYKWSTPSDKDLTDAVEKGILNTEQFTELISEENMFKRNVILKKSIFQIITSTNSSEFKKVIFKWIVNKWGGINVKNPDNLYKSVMNSWEHSLKENKLSFEGIASISKVLSFMLPEKYIIYDARVAYAINWILLKTKASRVFFPMPESRNSKLNAINISTLIRMSNQELYEDNIGTNKMISNCDKHIFIEKTMAYVILCNLISDINMRLWDDDKRRYPFYTEMLIFSLADTEIFSDMLKSCNLIVI